jgi:hypothetical protein
LVAVGWIASAGSPALRTDTKATIEATMSMPQWAASVNTATDPVCDAGDHP